jgi:hypothetical protein
LLVNALIGVAAVADEWEFTRLMARDAARRKKEGEEPPPPPKELHADTGETYRRVEGEEDGDGE